MLNSKVYYFSYLFSSDINECQTDNGGCTQTCDNIDGSYQCSCWDGYELTSDGHTCIGESTILLFIMHQKISMFCGSCMHMV